jgi:uncharacterized protein HemY
VASSTAELLTAGREAVAAGRWDAARQAFAASLAADESGEAHEGLGVVASWRDEATPTLTHRHRAGLPTVRGEPAIANGWLQRAEHLLDGLDPSAEHVWLEIVKAVRAGSHEGDRGATSQ